CRAMPIAFIRVSVDAFSYPRRQKTPIALASARCGLNAFLRAISDLQSTAEWLDIHNSSLESLESFGANQRLRMIRPVRPRARAKVQPVSTMIAGEGTFDSAGLQIFF